ncbi:MAG TPA: NADH:flavin oxidoreductase [Stackebrandtia sp.]|nr:NADH:flavin oxidoreductase [Stackebrandtia sp.]HZE38385.1 NADH:flavin oxidoreductase [Stackebrandtia sp.]
MTKHLILKHYPDASAASGRAAAVLGRPMRLGDLSVDNRIVMAPMTRQCSPGGIPGADVAAYYARRAAGGVGLIITEGTYIGHDSAGSSADVPRFHGDDALAGWSAVADAVHAAGGAIMPQLWHVGMDRAAGSPPVMAAPPMGPSGIPLDDRPNGKAMTPADLDEVIAAFAAAASAAEAAGFDGIELHGAHGYLIDQFLWGHTNRRTDGYGGDLAARTRFAAEIVAACRAAVSPGFPISFRMSQWKMGAYQARLADTPQQLDALLAPLARAGVDVFHCSTRRYWLPEFDDGDLNLAGWVKKLTGKPTITVGSVGLAGEFIASLQGEQTTVTAIDDLLDRMESDECDMVAVGRALLGDPEWAAKTLAGRHDQVTPFEPAALARLY